MPIRRHIYREQGNLVSDATVDKVFDYIRRTGKGTLNWFLIFDLAGGKFDEVPMGATADAHKDALYYIQSYAISDRLSETAVCLAQPKTFLAGFSELTVNDMKADGFLRITASVREP